MKTKNFLSILLIIFCISLAGPALSEDNMPGNLNQGQMNSRLTEEQQETLKAKIEEMKAAGASQEEIKSAVQELFKSWGIKPQNQGNQPHGRDFQDSLTDEQRQILKAKIEEMKAAGASEEEIKSAVQELFKSWGIKPQNQGNQIQKREFRGNLTDEQKEKLKATVQEMKAAGASQEEIKSAVKDLLKNWGITNGNQSQRRDWMDKLTDEQKKELKFTVEAMKNDGSSWEEIRTVVKNMLKDWGISTQSHDNQSQKRELMSQLTEEQRQELKSTVAEMKEAGVSQEEIRTVVKKMLKKWGITLEPPEQRVNNKIEK